MVVACAVVRRAPNRDQGKPRSTGALGAHGQEPRRNATCLRGEPQPDMGAMLSNHHEHEVRGGDRETRAVLLGLTAAVPPSLLLCGAVVLAQALLR